MTTQNSLLIEAEATLAARGKDYDSPLGERSMGKIVAIFAILTEIQMTETQGWMFMKVLKLVRFMTAKGYHRDSIVDDIAYSTLAAESRLSEVIESIRT